MGNDLDLALTLLRDLDNVTEVADTAVNLDLVLKELLEGGDVEDLVAGWLRSVDDELCITSPVSFSLFPFERGILSWVGKMGDVYQNIPSW